MSVFEDMSVSADISASVSPSGRWHVGLLADISARHFVTRCNTQPQKSMKVWTPLINITTSIIWIRNLKHTPWRVVLPVWLLRGLHVFSRLVHHKTTTKNVSCQWHTPVDRSFYKTQVLRCYIESIQMLIRKINTIFPMPGTPQMRLVFLLLSAFVFVYGRRHPQSLSFAYIGILINTCSHHRTPCATSPVAAVLIHRCN